MKRLAFTAALAAFFALPLAAQAPQAKHASKIGDRATQGMPRMNRKMADGLGLSEEQKTKIRAIQKETRERLAPILKEEMQKISATLTPEQKKKFAEMMKQRRGRMAGGQTGAMPRRKGGLGASDVNL